MPFKCHQRQSFLLGTEETFTFTFIEIINLVGYDFINRNKTVHPQASCINYEYAHKEHVHFPQNMRDLGKAHFIYHALHTLLILCEYGLPVFSGPSYLVSLNGHTECSIVIKPPHWPSFIAYCLHQHEGWWNNKWWGINSSFTTCVYHSTLSEFKVAFKTYKGCHWDRLLDTFLQAKTYNGKFWLCIDK